MKNHFSVLLIVALLALGIMAYAGLDSSSGAFSATPPKPMMKPLPVPIKPPIRPIVVDRSPDTVVVQQDYPVDYQNLNYADCILAREVRNIKDNLQMYVDQGLIDLVNRCNSAGI